MADTIADEASILAARSVTRPDHGLNSLGFKKVFYGAALEAGAAFAPAFDEKGQILPNGADACKAAQKAAYKVALAHLPQALEASQLNTGDPIDVIRSARFDDVLQLTAAQRGVALPEGLTAEAVRASLQRTVAADDYFRESINTLPMGAAVVSEMDDVQGQQLDVALRLANATWKAGQVHLAAKEGNDGRINPNVREAFNPYDDLMEIQCDRVIAEGGDEYDAVYRAAFEKWKDVDGLQALVKAA